MQTSSLLIVDDERDFVATLLKRMERRGLKCSVAFSGAEALGLVQNQDYRAVLLDMNLPDMDGNTVLRCIKKVKPDTPVLILTGYASVAKGQEGMAGGAACYLLKPVEFEMLHDKIRGMLRQKEKEFSGDAGGRTGNSNNETSEQS